MSVVPSNNLNISLYRVYREDFRGNRVTILFPLLPCSTFEIEPKLTSYDKTRKGEGRIPKPLDIKFKNERDRAYPRRGFDKDSRGLRVTEILSWIKKGRHHCVSRNFGSTLVISRRIQFANFRFRI